MDKATRIGIFDHCNYWAIAADLESGLRRNGYGNVKYIYLSLEGKPISQILDENSHEFDVFLLHPGSRNQNEAIDFIGKHPSKKGALVVLAEECYVKDKKIPIIPFSKDACDKIIAFIEGRLKM